MVSEYSGMSSRNGYLRVTPYARARRDNEGVTFEILANGDSGKFRRDAFFVVSLDLIGDGDIPAAENYRISYVSLCRPEIGRCISVVQTKVSRVASSLRERGTSVMDLLSQYLSSEKDRKVA